MSDGVDPAVGPADAADLCDMVYRTREEALSVVRRLRAAGWIVALLDVTAVTRPDGNRVLGSVYHPGTYQPVGEVVYTDPG